MDLPSAAVSNNIEKADERATHAENIHTPENWSFRQPLTLSYKGRVWDIRMLLGLFYFAFVVKYFTFQGDAKIYLMFELLGIHEWYSISTVMVHIAVLNILCLVWFKKAFVRRDCWDTVPLWAWHNTLVQLQYVLIVVYFYKFVIVGQHNCLHYVFARFFNSVYFFGDDMKQKILETDDFTAGWLMMITLFAMLIWNTVMRSLISTILWIMNEENKSKKTPLFHV